VPARLARQSRELPRCGTRAELWITSGWQLWGFTNSEADDRWHQLLGDRPLPDGVLLLGPRPRSELITIQQQAALTLYP
jgi:hypothetical protein